MLGIGVPGSDEAIRYAMAQDIKTDPATRGLTAGQQGALIEQRMAVAKGTMIDPGTQDISAKAIAGYQMAPPTGQAASRAGAAETMAKALQYNPDYQPGRFDEIKTAMTAFGSGDQGDKLRFLDVGTQHLDVFDKAINALNSPNGLPVVNALLNPLKTQYGLSAPNTFEGLKQIVATEISKAISGGIGTGDDRDRLMKSLDDAKNADQLHDMVNGFRSLMGGQLMGLKQQYEQSTGIKQGMFAFENKLTPAALAALTPAAKENSAPPSASVVTPPAPATEPAAAPKANAAPKPPAIGEVQQGYTFQGGDPSDPASWKAAK
jgi:hypothetical protein